MFYRNKLQSFVPCFAILSCVAAYSADETVNIKIGVAGPLSGSIAHLGKDVELGAKMAIADLNKKGLKIGSKNARFELVSEDDAGDPKQGTAVAQKFVDMNINGVVGHLNSGTSIPAARIYSEAGIPQISPASTNPKYTRQGFKTTFRVVADDTALGGNIGRYAVNTLNAKVIAVIDDRTAYGQGVAQEFQKAAEAAGAKVVINEFTSEKASDFSTILTNIKAKKPDLVFFGGNDAQAGPMLRQMVQLGITSKLMGGDGICTSTMSTLAGDAIGTDRVFCAEAGGVDGKLKTELEAWKTQFKSANGVEVQLFAPYAYDSVMALADAMQRAGSSSPGKYLDFLRSTKLNGLTGLISFDAKGDVVNGALTIYTFKGSTKTQLAIVR